MFGLNMNTDYFCFMAENEGHDELVSTRRAKLLAIAREIREDYSDYDEIDKIVQESSDAKEFVDRLFSDCIRFLEYVI